MNTIPPSSPPETVTFARYHTMTPSKIKPWGWLERKRWTYWLRSREPAPPSKVLRPVFKDARWTLLFVYLPSCEMGEAQRDTLGRLKLMDRRLLVVCATPQPKDVPTELLDAADALIWKGLRGFDFSGYAVGLHAVADGSPGADVLVINDSIFGPFVDIDPLLNKAPWDLTGFVGSNQYEVHIQSFAFLLRDVTPTRMRWLRNIFPRSYSFNNFEAVVMCFELAFARVAARQMSVGFLWFEPDGDNDPMLDHGLYLLDQGFPFLKRGLLGKHLGKQDEQAVRGALAARGLPSTIV